MLEPLILLTWCVALVVCTPIVLRRTALQIAPAAGGLWGALFYQQLAIILPAVFLTSYFGVDAFTGAFFVIKDSETFGVGLSILYATTMLILTLRALSRLFSANANDNAGNLSTTNRTTQYRFAIIATSLGLVLLIIGITRFGYKHAFISSMLTGENLLIARISNKYSTTLPSQAQYVLSVSSWVAGVFSGTLFAHRERFRAAPFFLSGLFLASAGGAKAAVVEYFLLVALSFGVVRRPVLRPKSVFGALFVAIPLLYFSIFALVSLQIPDLTLAKLNVYLANRVGVGQMAGTYEAFALGGLKGEFFWHMIPFANLFVEYPVFDKELMVLVEGFYRDATGVKNSLFIAEAFGIGGWPLAACSPFIVGASLALGFKLIWTLLAKLFGRAVADTYSSPLYFSSLPITGGFSSFPLFKGALLLSIVLFVFWIVKTLIQIATQRRMALDGAT